jgi:hypothetical protein
MALRRRTHVAVPLIAAEVLEVRSLLSAGAAAVHQAVGHAAHAGELTPDTTLHHAAPHAAPAVTQHLDARVEVTSSGSLVDDPMATSFSVSISKFNPGASVKVTAKFTFVFGGKAFVVSGTTGGKIVNSSQVGNLTELAVNPGSGKFLMQFTQAGQKTKVTYVPVGTLLTLAVDQQRNFVSIQGDYQPPNAPDAKLNFLFFAT